MINLNLPYMFFFFPLYIVIFKNLIWHYFQIWLLVQILCVTSILTAFELPAEPVGYGDALIAILPSFPGIKKLK